MLTLINWLFTLAVVAGLTGSFKRTAQAFTWLGLLAFMLTGGLWVVTGVDKMVLWRMSLILSPGLFWTIVMVYYYAPRTAR